MTAAVKMKGSLNNGLHFGRGRAHVKIQPLLKYTEELLVSEGFAQQWCECVQQISRHSCHYFVGSGTDGGKLQVREVIKQQAAQSLLTCSAANIRSGT